MCSALGKPEWEEDERFTQRHIRAKHSDVINLAMKELLSTMTMAEGVDHFTKHDVTAAPVNDIASAAADPHPWERRALVEVDDPIAGKVNVSGDFWHFSRTPAVVGSTPMPGEQTDELLAGLLDLSEDDIDRLRQQGVVG